MIPPKIQKAMLDSAFQTNEVKSLLKLSNQSLYEYTGDLPARLINSNDQPYLERYFLFERDGVFAYLHRFCAPDLGDRGPHNHPWRLAKTQVITGGYEQIVNTKRWFEGQLLQTKLEVLNKGAERYILGSTYHQIIRSQPNTWTMFLHTNKIQPWGMLAEEGGQHVFERYPSTNEQRWWLTAPTGSNVGRVPLLKDAA